MKLSVPIPIRTVSEANAHEHWRVRQRRAKAQREAVGLVCAVSLSGVRNDVLAGRAVVVTLERIAPRELDDDNLAGALKHVRDGVADALGLANDRDPRVTWAYSQARGEPKQYAVRVVVTPGYAGVYA